jgi:mono/diheme cytochrome c family protein
MNPQITSIVGVFFVLIGACATVIMLELRGNPKDRQINQRLIKAHRILGYVFVVLFLIMLFLMLNKASSYQEEFSPRAILHITLGTLLTPLLIIKILIVRRFKRLGAYLFGLGVTVFLTAFALNSITAGYYFLHQSDIQYVAISEGDTIVLDENMGRLLVSQKCAKCHTLERVFRSFKNEEGWTKTVNRMAAIDAPNIRDFDAKQIIHYLVKQQEIREELQTKIIDLDTEIGRTLVEQNCSTCHTLDRVYKASKTQEEWVVTIETMGDYMGDPEFITQEEKDTISEFLATQPDE